MEQNSEIVKSGKYVSESTFKREKHEVQVEGGILDFYDRKSHTINETKHSENMSELHIRQVQYYIYLLENLGIKNVKGVLHYPRQKSKREVVLEENDRREIEETLVNIKKIFGEKNPPPVINQPYCKKCAYYDLCYS